MENEVQMKAIIQNYVQANKSDFLGQRDYFIKFRAKRMIIVSW